LSLGETVIELGILLPKFDDLAIDACCFTDRHVDCFGKFGDTRLGKVVRTLQVRPLGFRFFQLGRQALVLFLERLNLLAQFGGRRHDRGVAELFLEFGPSRLQDLVEIGKWRLRAFLDLRLSVRWGTLDEQETRYRAGLQSRQGIRLAGTENEDGQTRTCEQPVRTCPGRGMIAHEPKVRF
jgi:hypothetical protein